MVIRGRLFVVLLSALSLSVAIADSSSSESQKPVDYWPTKEWRTSTPEQQGMDSAQLVKLFDYIDKRRFALDALLIVRNGHIVTEAYYAPFAMEQRHWLFSVTKSVLSAVAGIAVDDGRLDLDSKVVELFADKTIDNNDADKQAITVRHLLQMTSGFSWPQYVYYGDVSNNEMWNSPDPAQYALDRLMLYPPGRYFNYNEGATQLVSAIISRTTGKSAFALAKRRLFKPLGITDIHWASDTQGHSNGGGGLALRPRDLAKIGLLYLRNGVWEGRQILSASWINESTRPTVATKRSPDAYGYLWWVDSAKSRYLAAGRRGQFLLVLPKQDMVVVMNGRMADNDSFDATSLVDSFIVPSVKSASALPPKPEAHALLASRIQETTGERPLVAIAPPATAASVSRKRYTFSGTTGLREAMFDFSAKNPSYSFQWSNTDGHATRYTLPIDSRFQQANAPGETAVSRGAWVDDTTFVIEILWPETGYVCRENFQFEDTVVERSFKCGDGTFVRSRGET